MANIDLDAARAARAEAMGERGTVTFGGETYELPAEVTFESMEKLLGGDFRGGLDDLLGDNAKAFWELKPTVQDVRELAEGLAKLYTGHDAGESSASGSSSPKSSKRSRRPSPATTASS